MKHHHRILPLLRSARPMQTALQTHFVACPLALLQGQPAAQQLWQLSIYQLAFEQALADSRPSLPELDLLAAWN